MHPRLAFVRIEWYGAHHGAADTEPVARQDLVIYHEVWCH